MTRLRGWAPKGERPSTRSRRASGRPRRSLPLSAMTARCALPVRRPDQRLTLPRLCRAVPRPDPQAGRRCDPRQSRLHKGKGVRKAIRAVGARLVFLPKYSPTSTPSSRSSPSSRLCCETPKPEATRRSPTQAVKSSPSTRPPNAPHTSRTQDTGKAKCKYALGEAETQLRAILHLSDDQPTLAQILEMGKG